MRYGRGKRLAMAICEATLTNRAPLGGAWDAQLLNTVANVKRSTSSDSAFLCIAAAAGEGEGVTHDDAWVGGHVFGRQSRNRP